jgi:hypothetical protein
MPEESRFTGDSSLDRRLSVQRYRASVPNGVDPYEAPRTLLPCSQVSGSSQLAAQCWALSRSLPTVRRRTARPAPIKKGSAHGALALRHAPRSTPGAAPGRGRCGRARCRADGRSALHAPPRHASPGADAPGRPRLRSPGIGHPRPTFTAPSNSPGATAPGSSRDRGRGVPFPQISVQFQTALTPPADPLPPDLRHARLNLAQRQSGGWRC